MIFPILQPTHIRRSTRFRFTAQAITPSHPWHLHLLATFHTGSNFSHTCNRCQAASSLACYKSLKTRNIIYDPPFTTTHPLHRPTQTQTDSTRNAQEQIGVGSESMFCSEWNYQSKHFSVGITTIVVKHVAKEQTLAMISERRSVEINNLLGNQQPTGQTASKINTKMNREMAKKNNIQIHQGERCKRFRCVKNTGLFTFQLAQANQIGCDVPQLGTSRRFSHTLIQCVLFLDYKTVAWTVNYDCIVILEMTSIMNH